MKKLSLILLFLLISAPLSCWAEGADIRKESMGTLSGQMINDAGVPLQGGGVVSFFNADNGTPPLIGGMHRIPDMVGRLGQDGMFSVKLLAGSYYLGALIITDPGRGPGPPREGEKFYFARDDKGALRKFTLATKEIKDAGPVIGALPETFPLAGNLVTITGKLVLSDGSPFAGGVVLVKTDINSPRPDFVSARTGEDGMFELHLPAGIQYYLLGRERTAGRPVPGTYIGTYGSTTSISEGGSLPIGNARPVQPASGMPQIEGVTQGPGTALPKTVGGMTGETISGIDIMMFKMPVPGEQREKLQGTLGFDEKTNPTGTKPEKDK